MSDDLTPEQLLALLDTENIDLSLYLDTEPIDLSLYLDTEPIDLSLYLDTKILPIRGESDNQIDDHAEENGA